jgi:hypothetical protein
MTSSSFVLQFFAELARCTPPTWQNPEISPSDFFLFEITKTELQNYEIHSRHDLILAIKTVFDEIPKDMLNSVCVSWRKRLK